VYVNRALDGRRALTSVADYPAPASVQEGCLAVFLEHREYPAQECLAVFLAPPVYPALECPGLQEHLAYPACRAFRNRESPVTRLRGLAHSAAMRLSQQPSPRREQPSRISSSCRTPAVGTQPISGNAPRSRLVGAVGGSTNRVSA